ncbi:MAG TPA: hypothetical protein VJ746_12535 [Nitrospira sp.]|nr:hypothetical protein [Nitrospira sp.]
MSRLVLPVFSAMVAWMPTVALAEGAGGGYRGIGMMYYTLMWVVLSYGLYDTFGKTALYIGAPILAVAAYLLLPPA